MLGWLKKITETEKTEYKNKAGLSKKKLSLLKKDFEKMDSVRSVSSEVLRYILDGEGEDILSILANTGGFASALKLISINQYGGLFAEIGERAEFYRNIEIKNPDFYLRIAKVYEACTKQESVYLKGKNYLPPGTEWLEIFLREATHFQTNIYPPRPINTDMEIDIVEKMLELSGNSPDTIARMIFFKDPKDWNVTGIVPMYTGLRGFKEYASRHKKVILEALEQKDGKRIIYILDLLEKCNISTEGLAGKITDLSLSKAKTIREAAEKLIHSIKEQALTLLKEISRNGTGDERFYAVKLLWKLAGEKIENHLREIQKNEKSKKILQIISEILESEEKTGDRKEEIILPPLPKIRALEPPGKEVFQSLKNFAHIYNRRLQELFVFWKNQGRTNIKTPELIKDSQIKKAFHQLGSLVLDKKSLEPVITAAYTDNIIAKGIRDFIAGEELKLIHAVRFLLITGKISCNKETSRFYLNWDFDSLIEHYRKTHRSRFDLRELAQVFKIIGMDDRLIGWYRLQGWYPAFRYEDAALWPYFWENIDILEHVFELKKLTDIPLFYYDKGRIRKNAFQLLNSFPKLPLNFETILMEIATGPVKTERPLAQKCLEKVPGIKERIIPYISDGKQDTRAAAAEWLGNLGVKEAIPIIEKALKKEKLDTVKVSFMNALEKLGVSVKKFLDRDKLLKEAEKLVEKGIPEGLKWFPFERIPSVHWIDTGKMVEKDIIKYFILKTYKLKSPEADSLLIRYCSYFKKQEKEDLGKFILEAWINQDTLPAYSYDEAYKKAEQNATATIQWYKDMTAEELTRRYLNSILNECKGSAIKEKGILALAGACSGPDSVRITERYLKKWYGLRASQCKALIQMLSWIDHPMTAQLLLSVANRFRTKGIQKEAEKYVNILAERKGWTLEELGDRTIPTGGFDENGKMELDYGTRFFIAKLSKDFKINLFTSEGKELKNLPSPGKGDDEEKAKEAKANLSSAKKEIKATLKLQKERLYEAMCTQRRWIFSEWDTYLKRHPLIKYHCQSLIWGIFEGEKLLKTFRPLDDGTFTDYEDEEVILKESDIIRIAHPATTGREIAGAWAEHMKDYEIKPLFDQFERDYYILPENLKDETELTEFEGYLLDAFTLRGQAGKLGYVRGQAEDGGWFYTYVKNFSGIGIESLIEFSGNPLPEENRKVALMKLFFMRSITEQTVNYESRKISLGNVPSVLLSECRYDMKMIADKGEGYHPDWNDKVQW